MIVSPCQLLLECRHIIQDLDQIFHQGQHSHHIVMVGHSDVEYSYHDIPHQDRCQDTAHFIERNNMNEKRRRVRGRGGESGERGEGERGKVKKGGRGKGGQTMG